MTACVRRVCKSSSTIIQSESVQVHPERQIYTLTKMIYKYNHAMMRSYALGERHHSVIFLLKMLRDFADLISMGIAFHNLEP